MKRKMYSLLVLLLLSCVMITSGVQASTSPEAEEETDEAVRVSRIHFADSYQEIYDALKKAEPERYYYYDDIYYDDAEYYTEGAAEMDAVGIAPANSAKSGSVDMEVSMAESSDTAYSETNVRTEGVDESDVVKTDGKYIYVLRNHSDLAVVKADGAKMEKLSEIHISDAVSYWYGGSGAREFFVKDKLLHVICEKVQETDNSYWYGSQNRVTTVITYDLSDPVSPVLVGEMEQDGSFLQARMQGGSLYIFTQWRPYLGDGLEDSSIIAKAGGEEISPQQTCIPKILTDANYLIISSLDPERPSEAADSKILVSGAQQLYVSSGGIYAMNVDYNSSREKTEIVKFTYENGAIEGRAAGTVRGSINDTFSIDEYNGYLRVLTTYMGSLHGNFIEVLSDLFGFDYDSGDRWTRHNALFVLDEDMKRVSQIVDLAEGEDIRSARYFGDKAYFVTFRNTDPLFTVDLSDPSSPKITDELKIPGFSKYLHPFGENLLLGLGFDADENTGTVRGIKISLFDLKGDEVVETDRTIIDRVTYFPALDEYKAIFADAARGLVGFYLNDRYFVYQLSEEGGFTRILLYDFFEDALQCTEDDSSVRGLFIGDTFYIAGNGGIVAFDMENGFEKESVLRLG